MSQLKFAVLDFGVSHLTTRQIKERLPGIKRVGLVDQRLKELPALMGAAWEPCQQFAQHILGAARQAVDASAAARFRPQVFVFSMDASEPILREAMGLHTICTFTATPDQYLAHLHSIQQLDMVCGLVEALQRCSNADPTFTRISQALELTPQERATITMHPELVQAMLEDYDLVAQRLKRPLTAWLDAGWKPAPMKAPLSLYHAPIALHA
jgi:hypothetical protein